MIKYFPAASLIAFFLLLLNPLTTTAQKEPKETFYRLTMGGGIGNGYPNADGNGIGGMLEFAYQQNKALYAVGYTGMGEFNIFDQSNVHNSVQSINLTYGRAYMYRSIFMSISAGPGFVSTVAQGALKDRLGFIFTTSTYEKITAHTVGLAFSAKAMALAPHGGIGLEFYANANSQSSFAGINLCFQFGKLRSKKNAS